MAYRLKKSNPLFYSKIGGKGGSATRDNQPEGYYAKIARLSHAARRERRVAELKEQGLPCPKCDSRKFPLKAARMRNNKLVCKYCGSVPR